VKVTKHRCRDQDRKKKNCLQRVGGGRLSRRERSAALKVSEPRATRAIRGKCKTAKERKGGKETATAIAEGAGGIRRRETGHMGNGSGGVLSGRRAMENILTEGEGRENKLLAKTRR